MNLQKLTTVHEPLTLEKRSADHGAWTIDVGEKVYVKNAWHDHGASVQFQEPLSNSKG